MVEDSDGSHCRSRPSERAQMRLPELDCIHHLFERQVEAAPNALALTFEGQTLTYRELNDRSNRIAHRLQKHHVGPESLVAICLERSLEMVVAILGVLKAGGTYVPLDPSYPRRRLAHMLQDSQAKLLLTQSQVTDRLPGGTGCPCICLDREWENILGENGENPKSHAGKSSAAYVIYTSGSTGVPKGVVVTHRNILRLFTSTDEWFQFGRQDVWTLFHSYAFDFSVWEIWGALAYGGRLVVVPYAISRSPVAFHELLRRERVTVLNQTPSAFDQLMWADESAGGGEKLDLRYVIFGGEALRLEKLKPWFERHGDERPRLVNMYGITETTVHVTYRPLLRRDAVEGNGSLIGRPIPDLELLLLNDGGKLCDTGETGEMHVGGPGLARGYLNRPDLTAERFVELPTRTGERFYRTGDLARRLENGEFEYIGRADQQVKIRGFRIELGEIESVLERHPSVRDGVVIAEESEAGDKRLMAYVVASGSSKPRVQDLRSFLGESLPDYMIPSTFHFLSSIPLTPNGKIDRKALPRAQTRPELNNPWAEPQTETEKELAEIWSEVLEIQSVGIDDNFFELGGDSIRSLRILARAAARGYELSSSDLFEHRTIRSLVQSISKKSAPVSSLPKVEAFYLVSDEDRRLLPEGLEDAYPLAKLQTGMLYHSELNPDSAIFHDVFSFRIEAEFDRSKFESALIQLLARHPILRSSFDLGRFSEPLQLVHFQVDLPWSIEDVSHLTPDEQTKRLVAFIESEKERAFDWSRAPLLRFHILLLDPGSFQFIVSFHHAILDGWSLASLLTEVLQDYFGMLNGADSKLEKPKVLYRDFVALEKKALASSECKAFWADQLKEPHFQLLPRWPKAYRISGREQVRGPEILISGEVFKGLKQLAQTEKLPLRSVLLAAHFRVLNQLQGQSDVISGLVLNGRPEVMDGDRMIGLFLNTVPARLKLEGGTWTDLVRQTFDLERKLLPHRRYPLIEIQRMMEGRSLFEVAFDFVHFHVYRRLQGYSGTGFAEGHYFEANNFTLLTTFMLHVDSSQLQMHFDYDPSELSADQIRAMCDYYENTLSAMAARPNDRYELFSPLSVSEKNTILVDWNSTRKDFPRSKCIHELVEEQAERTPDATAAILEKRKLTYAELNGQANRLAHFLNELGVKPGVHVAVCMDRSCEMISSLLAILKAGGTYVPLEPGFPASRMETILSSLKAPCLITERHHLSKFAHFGSRLSFLRDLVCLESAKVDGNEEVHFPSSMKIWSGSELSRFSSVNPIGTTGPEGIAYVIFTSGSTGTPKGVMIRHRSVVNLIDWVNSSFHVDESDVLLFVTSICFDLSVYDIFGTLAAGGCIRIASDLDVRNPERLLKILYNEPITFWDSAPAALQQLLPFFQPEPRTGARLKRIFLSGDWIPVVLPDLMKNHFPGAEVISLGGATEAAVWSNFYPIRRVEPEWTSIPYGKPIQNCQYYVLDQHRLPCPIGVAGDLYIGGECLAVGYFNDPELTARKFIAHPFRDHPGERLYATGDLARFLPDGNIEFLGRNDDQVKIRGFRVELGEIEAVLLQHSGVRECVVLHRTDILGRERLTAYAVLHPSIAPSIPELKRHLANFLPEYMVPASFVLIEALPLTSNGKVDRKALPVPDQDRSELQSAFAPPRNLEEEILAEIWGRALGVKQVGIHDNFFELGGHSLVAVQVVSRIRRVFKIELPLHSLFDLPTIAQMSSELGRSYPHPGILQV